MRRSTAEEEEALCLAVAALTVIGLVMPAEAARCGRLAHLARDAMTSLAALRLFAALIMKVDADALDYTALCLYLGLFLV